MHTLDIDGILKPLGREEFLNDYYDKKFIHVPGDRQKFDEVMNWGALNTILGSGAFDASNVLVYNAGTKIPPEGFSRSSRLSIRKLTDFLRQGATLVLNNLDQMYEPVQLLAQRLARTLQCHVGTNLYAGWTAVHGFDVHWDDHDVFILQISGRKRWQIFGKCSMPYPVRGAQGNDPPSGSPEWDCCLETGDLLYLPRGWWHVATPCNEPTLHLTVGIHCPTGLDFMEWLSGGLNNAVAMRMDVPRLADRAAQDEFLARIRQATLDALDRPGILQTFLRERAENADPRRWCGLPWSATPDAMPDSEDLSIVLAMPHLKVRHPSGTNDIDFRFDGNTYTFPEETEPLLNSLLSDGRMSIRDFYAKWDDSFEREELRAFLSDLAKAGILTFREP